MKLDLTIRLGIAALALATTVNFAQAGECPAGKMKDNALTTGEMMPKKVTDDVLSSIDLAPKGDAFKGESLRLRKLVIQPGGVVPWHSHADRPALIYVVSGEIYEHASNCAVPILHKAGEVARETHATAHWWKNDGKVPVVLLSFDIQHDPNDRNM